jgi:hypothetical protein
MQKVIEEVILKFFGARITEFGVMVGKIQGFDVWRAILWIYLGLWTSLELFFKNQGSNYEILDRGLITQKSRDLSTN